jgi:hypothetical protein
MSASGCPAPPEPNNTNGMCWLPSGLALHSGAGRIDVCEYGIIAYLCLKADAVGYSGKITPL